MRLHVRESVYSFLKFWEEFSELVLFEDWNVIFKMLNLFLEEFEGGEFLCCSARPLLWSLSVLQVSFAESISAMSRELRSFLEFSPEGFARDDVRQSW